jgi:hypothetical protein
MTPNPSTLAYELLFERKLVVSPNPGLLAALLKTGKLSGLLRWKVVLADEAVQGECSAANWRPLVLDSRNVRTLEELIQISVVELDIPTSSNPTVSEWETALETLFSTEQPTCLVWLGWQELVKNAKDDAAVAVSIFEDLLKSRDGVVLIVGHQGTFPDIDELALA